MSSISIKPAQQDALSNSSINLPVKSVLEELVIDRIFPSLQSQLQRAAKFSDKGLRDREIIEIEKDWLLPIQKFASFLIDKLGEEEFPTQKQSLIDLSTSSKIQDLKKFPEIRKEIINVIRTLNKETISALKSSSAKEYFMQDVFELSEILRQIDEKGFIYDCKDQYIAVQNLSKAGYLTEAIKIAEKEAWLEKRESFFRVIFKDLVLAGNLNKSIEGIKNEIFNISPYGQKVPSLSRQRFAFRDVFGILKQVFRALVKADQCKEAIDFTGTIADKNVRKEVFFILSEVLVDGRKLDEAVKLAQDELTVTRRADAFLNISGFLANAGEYAEAIEYAERELTGSRQKDAFNHIARVLASKGFFEKSIGIAEKIDEEWYSIDSLFHWILNSYVDFDGYKEAINLVEKKIKSQVEKDKAFECIFKRLMNNDQYLEAVSCTDNMSLREKELCLLDIVSAYLSRKELQEAIKYAEQITEEGLKDHAFSYISRNLADHGKFTAAFNLVDKISNKTIKSNTHRYVLARQNSRRL